MRKVILYIAMSLDGYIADSSEKVDWLNGHGSEEENMDTYSAFIRDMDTIIMGWNTYRQVTTELSPDEGIYKELTTYVITHRRLSSAENIKFVQDNPCSIVEKLKSNAKAYTKEQLDVWASGCVDLEKWDQSFLEHIRLLP